MFVELNNLKHCKVSTAALCSSFHQFKGSILCKILLLCWPPPPPPPPLGKIWLLDPPPLGISKPLRRGVRVISGTTQFKDSSLNKNSPMGFKKPITGGCHPWINPFTPKSGINFKFPLHPHQKYYITHQYEEPGLLIWKMILPILTTSLRKCTIWPWE